MSETNQEVVSVGCSGIAGKTFTKSELKRSISGNSKEVISHALDSLDVDRKGLESVVNEAISKLKVFEVQTMLIEAIARQIASNPVMTKDKFSSNSGLGVKDIQNMFDAPECKASLVPFRFPGGRVRHVNNLAVNLMALQQGGFDIQLGCASVLRR